MKNKIIFTVLATSSLIACTGVDGNGSSQIPSTEQAPQSVTVTSPALPVTGPVSMSSPLPTSSPSPTPSSGPLDLIYYYYSTTIAISYGPNSSPTKPTGVSYGIGSCVIYLNNTYCWDDGIKTIVLPSPFVSASTSFWGIDKSGNVCGPSVNCASDLMLSPTLITPNLAVALNWDNFDNYPQDDKRSPYYVLNFGTPKNVRCYIYTDNTLRCVDFIIDLNQ